MSYKLILVNVTNSITELLYNFNKQKKFGKSTQVLYIDRFTCMIKSVQIKFK